MSRRAWGLLARLPRLCALALHAWLRFLLPPDRRTLGQASHQRRCLVGRAAGRRWTAGLTEVRGGRRGRDGGKSRRCWRLAPTSPTLAWLCPRWECSRCEAARAVLSAD